MQRREFNEIIRQVALLGQFGLSLVMPMLICIGICVFLTLKAGFGMWVYIPGFIFGLGSSFMTAYKFYLAESSKGKKEEKKTVSFNSHE